MRCEMIVDAKVNICKFLKVCTGNVLVKMRKNRKNMLAQLVA
jgi:hypothetical protein